MWKNLLHVSAERTGSEVGQYDEGSYLVAPQSSEPAVRQTGGVLVRRAGLSEGQAGTDKRTGQPGTSLEGRPGQASGGGRMMTPTTRSMTKRSAMLHR